MLWTSSSDWSSGTFAGTTTSNGALVLVSGTSSGTWTSGIVDFTKYVTSWDIILASVGNVGYLTRSGPSGHPNPDSTWTPWTAGLVEPPEQYGQIELTLSGASPSVTSLEWLFVSTIETRTTGNIFRRLIQENFGLGINIDGKGAPAITLKAPSGITSAYATVENERLSITITSAAAGSSGQGFSFDLSTGNTLNDLVGFLKANLSGWVIALSSPPANFGAASLGNLPAAVLEDMNAQNLLTNPILNMWTSVLWLLLKPIAQVTSEASSANSAIPNELSIVRAEGAWLTRWGDSTGVRRYPSEPDSLYRQRMLLMRFTPPTPLAMQQYLGFQVETTSAAHVQILYPATYQTAPTFHYTESQVLDTYSRLIPIGFAVSVNVLASQVEDRASVIDQVTSTSLAIASITYDYGSPVKYDSLGVWR